MTIAVRTKAFLSPLTRELITTQAQEEARIFKDDNIKLYAELGAAEARIRGLEKEIAALRKVVG
jgi:hypothetical protein